MTDMRDIVLGQQARRHALSGQGAPQRVISATVVADVAVPGDPLRCKDVLTGLEFTATAWTLNGTALPATGDSCHVIQSSSGDYVCLSYGIGSVSVGSGGDLSYTHTENTPASTWSVTHNLGKFPSVTIVDSGGSELDAAITHTSTSALTIEFFAATSGKAYCN